MDLVEEKFKIAVNMYDHYILDQTPYTNNSNNITTPFERYVDSEFCKANNISAKVEQVCRWLFDLDLAPSTNHTSDGLKTYAKTGTTDLYEMRCAFKGFCWGPSTLSGKNRCLEANASLEKCQEHNDLIMCKINAIKYYIVVDLRYPPYWFIYKINHNEILHKVHDGSLLYDTEDNRNGFVKNDITINQFFNKFLNTSNNNPHDLENINDTPNPFNMTPEKIDQMIQELGYDVESISWQKRMGKNNSKKDKELKARASEIIIF
jgi:hypothetical protein